MSVTPLKKEKTDDRAELRRAVADCVAARAAVDKHREAIERAREHVTEAAGNAAAADTALNAAQRDHAQRIATAIADGSSPTATGLIRAARAHERDAEDELAAAKDALARLEADLADLEVDAAAGGRAVDDALRDALEPMLRALIEATRAHHASYLRAQVAMTVVAGLRDPWDPLRKEAGFIGLGSAADGRTMDASRREWESALAALRLDADAPLPTDDEARG
jgi:hypothetical protein